MTKLELRRLRSLQKRLQYAADKLWRQTNKNYAKAGTSAEDGGTGDEGWMKVHQDGGTANGLDFAAASLKELIEKLEVRK